MNARRCCPEPHPTRPTLAAYTEASQTVFCPHAADFLIGCKFTTLRLRSGFCERGLFFHSQLVKRLVSVLAGKKQEDTRKLVLLIWRQGTDALNGVLQKFGHAAIMHTIYAGKKDDLIRVSASVQNLGDTHPSITSVTLTSPTVIPFQFFMPWLAMAR